MDILLMGPPGAGKGTQGAILAEALGLPKFATGDLLRDAVQRGTPLGLKAKAAMEAGHLVSDEIILGVVRDEFGKPEASQGVLFDGVVRTMPQAEGMAAILTEKGARTDARALLRRDRRGDPQPAREAPAVSRTARTTIPRPVAVRLKAYRDQTGPVLSHYERQGLVRHIPAVGCRGRHRPARAERDRPLAW
jgi:adenylate kinase